MFQDKVSKDGMVYVASSVIPAVHAFSTRYGGAGKGDFATVNFSARKGDDIDAVRENYRRWCAIFGAGINDCCKTDQVHGNNVEIVTSADRHICFSQVSTECDGVVTGEKDLPIFCFTADCVPVILCDKEGKSAAAVHCGWKSSVKDILGVAVEKMKSFGTKPENICAALGPSIGKCCFETDRDVPDAVEEYLSGDTEGLWIIRPDGKYVVDLRGANARRLVQLGILSENIDISEECTVCSHDKFWSARYTNRYGLKRGTMAAGIVLR